MSDELNRLLESKWFVLDSNGDVMARDDEQDAHDSAQRWNGAFPDDAPHHAVQLQVKGTIPEGALMPKYKVGDRVMFKGSEVFRVTGVKNVYAIESLDGKYGCGAGESELQPATPIDPLREEFEAWWSPMLPHGGLTCGKENAWLIWQAAKAGAKWTMNW